MQDIVVLPRMNLVAYTLVLVEIEVHLGENFRVLPFLYCMICIMPRNNKDSLHLFFHKFTVIEFRWERERQKDRERGKERRNGIDRIEGKRRETERSRKCALHSVIIFQSI